MKIVNHQLKDLPPKDRQKCREQALKIGYKESYLPKLLFRIENGDVVIRDNYLLARIF